MSWESIMGLIKPELFILVVFLWCIGLFLKKTPWFTADWMIPFILLGISLVITILYIAVVFGGGFTPLVFVTGVIQAVLIAALSVFGNEVLKQLGIKRDEYKNTKSLFR